MDHFSGKAAVRAALRAIALFRVEALRGHRLTFERHVAPVYKWIELAHVDYVAGFRATKAVIAQSKKPDDVLAFLWDIRRGALMTRGQALVALDSLLEEGEHSPRSLPSGWRHAKGFYQAGRGYLYGATAPAATSWYSDYIRFVEISSKHLPGDCWVQSAFGNDPRSDLMLAIERSLDRIELSFRAVTQQYLLAERNLVQ